MLGAVAIFYFFAAALAMAIACCGPDPRAKFCSAYLMVAWGLSNRIFVTSAPADALAEFSYYDALACVGVFATMVAWPSRWIALLLAALTTQVIFQAYHRAAGPSISASFAVNEAMYVLQLVAVTIPTLAQVWRRWKRRRARALKTARRRIPPPYPGWHPPDDYRDQTS